MLVEIRGCPRDTGALEVVGGGTNQRRGLGEPAYDQTLWLAMLAAGLAGTAGADQNVDALIADFGAIVDAEQNQLDLGMSLLEWRHGAQQHAAAKCRPHANLELPIAAAVGLEPADSFGKAVQHLGCVSIEAGALGRQLQDPRRSREEHDTQALFQVVDGPAYRGRINQQAARRRHKAAAFDHPNKDYDPQDADPHEERSRRIDDIFAFLASAF